MQAKVIVRLYMCGMCEWYMCGMCVWYMRGMCVWYMCFAPPPA